MTSRQTAEEFLSCFHSQNRLKQFQLLEAHREADRREENVHEHDLQRVVEGDEGRARRVERSVHRREADAAHQRRGDAVPA